MSCNLIDFSFPRWFLRNTLWRQYTIQVVSTPDVSRTYLGLYAIPSPEIPIPMPKEDWLSEICTVLDVGHGDQGRARAGCQGRPSGSAADSLRDIASPRYVS
jgi:hypothetical protein